MIRTSSPYALCHQLSNGAEASIIRPPHAEMKEPSGPERPQIRTLTSRNADARRNVVDRMRYADERPASTPHA